MGLALQMAMTLAGLGLGAWAVDLHDASPGEGIPVGAALWTGLSMLSRSRGIGSFGNDCAVVIRIGTDQSRDLGDRRDDRHA